MLRIATFNLHNFGLWSAPLRYARIVDCIVGTLKLPDLVGLQEIGVMEENETRHASAQACAQNLIDLIWQRSHIQYAYVEQAPLPNSSGGEPRFNIRCGALYRIDTLTVEAFGVITPEHPAFSGDPNQNWLASRKALWIRFCTHHGQSLLVVVCHLKSQRNDTRDQERAAKAQRQQQAIQIYSWVCAQKQQQSLPSASATVILGDCNDQPESATLSLLRTGVFISSDERLRIQAVPCCADPFHLQSVGQAHPRKTIYTRRYAGKPQALDHILYSEELKLVESLFAHVNSDVPSLVQSSDHDPVVAGFDWVTK